jgi:hypothetical protein
VVALVILKDARAAFSGNLEQAPECLLAGFDGPNR